MFDSTFGHDGAFVSALSRSRSSSADVLLSLAAVVMLHRVIENPGPLREVSNVPEYIFVGLIFQFFSIKSQHEFRHHPYPKITQLFKGFLCKYSKFKI